MKRRSALLLIAVSAVGAAACAGPAVRPEASAPSTTAATTTSVAPPTTSVAPATTASTTPAAEVRVEAILNSAHAAIETSTHALTDMQVRATGDDQPTLARAYALMAPVDSALKVAISKLQKAEPSLPQADTPEVDSLISSLAFDVQANEQSPPQSWMTNPPLPGYDSAYIEQLLALLLDSDASFEPLVFLPNS